MSLTTRHFAAFFNNSMHDDSNGNSGGSNRRVPMPNFDDAKATYQSKTLRELLTAFLSFGLCQIPPLVRNAEPLLKFTRRVAGDSITDRLLKATLFGHFCAGEDEPRIRPTIQRLREAGIGSILDYAAEDDVGTVSSPGSTPGRIEAGTNYPKVRSYDYESESKCDRHVETFQQCIQSVANLGKDGFAAIKVTALGNPKLLARMSRAIVEAENLFAKFDVDQDGFISNEEFERGLHLFFDDIKENTNIFRRRLQELLPGNESQPSKVDYITWSMLLAPRDLPLITEGCREFGPLAMAAPTTEEVELIERMFDRGRTIAQTAAEHGVRLLIDAEQQRFQPAIDNLVLELQYTYNSKLVTEFPVIYNTYQCYLKDASRRLHVDLERSKRYDYHFGAKLVRGAYMESERALAASLGLPSPIHDTKADTDACYNDAVKFLLEQSIKANSNVEFMCATHNQDTIEKALHVMGELNIGPEYRTISFAQLYGMMDNLTFNLGKHGFRAFKYVPYGEVKMVIPYLLRRANENSSLSGGARKELRMISRELRRRLFRF
jgi:proline dehydrogenase